MYSQKRLLHSIPATSQRLFLGRFSSSNIWFGKCTNLFLNIYSEYIVSNRNLNIEIIDSEHYLKIFNHDITAINNVISNFSISSL